MDKIAEVEKQLKRLNRDYGVVEGRHQELLRRWESLQSRKRLDPVTDNVQFNVLEPPFSSTEPVAPDRPLLMIAVLIVALGIGGAVAFGLDELKPVFYSRAKLTRVSGLPVLGSVGMVFSQGQHFARRRNLFAWISGNAMLAGLCGVLIVYVDPIRHAIRDLIGTI